VGRGKAPFRKRQRQKGFRERLESWQRPAQSFLKPQCLSAQWWRWWWWWSFARYPITIGLAQSAPSICTSCQGCCICSTIGGWCRCVGGQRVRGGLAWHVFRRLQAQSALGPRGQARVPGGSPKTGGGSQPSFPTGHEAMPLAQQVASLEKKVAAKIKEAETIRGQMASLNVRLEVIGGEGAALEQQLSLAKAKLATAPTPARPPPASPSFDIQAVMNFMRDLSGMLPPEMGGSFATCLDHIQRVSVGPVTEEPAPMDVGSTPPCGADALSMGFPLPPPALPPAGRAGGADSAPTPLAPAASLEPAEVVDLEAETYPSSTAVASAVGSATSGFQNIFGPVRGRAAGSSSRAAPFAKERKENNFSPSDLVPTPLVCGCRAKLPHPTGEIGQRRWLLLSFRTAKGIFPSLPRGLGWAISSPPSRHSWFTSAPAFRPFSPSQFSALPLGCWFFRGWGWWF